MPGNGPMCSTNLRRRFDSSAVAEGCADKFADAAMHELIAWQLGAKPISET